MLRSHTSFSIEVFTTLAVASTAPAVSHANLGCQVQTPKIQRI